MDDTDLWYMPGVLEHTRWFLGPRPAPSEADLRAALGQMIGSARELQLQPGQPGADWTPPPLLQGFNSLSVVQHDGRTCVQASGPESGGKAPGLIVGVDFLPQRQISVTFAAVVAPAPGESLDPVTFSAEFGGAVVAVSWAFIRGSRWYYLRAWQLELDHGPWAGILEGSFGAGETIEVPAGSTLVANAVADPRRPPRLRHLGHHSVRLLERAYVVLGQVEEPLPTPEAAFEDLVWRLPVSKAMVPLERNPDSRLH